MVFQGFPDCTNKIGIRTEAAYITDIKIKISESNTFFALNSNPKLNILSPKFPAINKNKLTVSARKNFGHAPSVCELVLAKESLTHPTRSGESTIEWINQNGAKI